MPDYYPVIQRAVSSLASNSGEARQALYDRARSALLLELHKHDPPLSKDQITQQSLALDAVIRKVEAEFRQAQSPKPLSSFSLPAVGALLVRVLWSPRGVITLAVVFGVVIGFWFWSRSTPAKTDAPMAKQFELAAIAYQTAAYEDAARLMRPLAEAGDANAQFNLATAIWRLRLRGAQSDEHANELGDRLKWLCLAALQEDAEAQFFIGLAVINKAGNLPAYWWTRAATNGDPDAQEIMALNYHFGNGVPRDDKEAVRLLRAAAEAGHDGAQMELGDILWDGKGKADPPWTLIRQDYVEAAKWYLAAAERGNSLAQQKIGQMYYQGVGVLQNLEQSYFWLSLASADLPGALGGENAARLRDFVATRLTTERLNIVQQQSVSWRASASAQKQLVPEWRRGPSQAGSGLKGEKAANPDKMRSPCGP